MSDWRRVETIFVECVDLPADERARFLRDACGDDRELLREVESLLAADTDSAMLIEAAVQEEVSHIFDPQVLIGERLGTYRIVREIGRGGMGSVYLAIRDDDEYRKEVALKVVKRGMDTAEVLRRFRYERQILANLEHPFIARLFDGGSTPDGVPFFVMEYIEGRPIDVFCRESSLGFDDRCELFLHVLEAVSYAHRNLVVHRDLKPTNILVSADGTPKLLDFGVAKVIGGDAASDQTLTASARPFTPGYASPEQVRGKTVTTSSDIYSLGAVLYEMLTGLRAQPIESQTPLEIERSVCETEVPRPSLAAKGLSSDLDNIVLMAMRKEPERRYQSAAQFAEDIQRYLDGRPVKARQDSVAYRAEKFFLRNRLAVVAAGVVTVALIAAVVVSLAQTRRAEAARGVADSQRMIALQQTAEAEAARRDETEQHAVADQQRTLAEGDRDEAEKQKGIADEHLKDILDLANRTLFDVHDAIAPLPGAVSARQAIVKTTLDYLENLESHVGLDDHMREVLGAAYYKVAMIQGDSQAASLQDSEGAGKSLRKAQELLAPAYQRHPNSVSMMMRWIEIKSALAEALYRSGQTKEAIAGYVELIPVAHRLSLIEPCRLECKTQEAALDNSLAYDLIAADPVNALKYAKQGIAIMEKLTAEHPAEDSLKQAVGALTAAAAGAYKGVGDLENAEPNYLKSIAVREDLHRRDPNNSVVSRSLLVVSGNYATILGVPWSQNLGRPADAHRYAAKSVAIAREMVSADPKDATAKRDLGMILGRLGMIDPAPGEAAGSLANLQEARSLIAPIIAANPKSSEGANQVALILEYEGHRQEELGRKDEAVESYRRSMGLLEPFLTKASGTSVIEYIASEESLARLYASSGNAASALELADNALAEAEKYNLMPPPSAARVCALAAAWSTIADARFHSGDAARAKLAADKAMDLWGSVNKAGALTAYRKPIAETRMLLGSLAAR